MGELLNWLLIVVCVLGAILVIGAVFLSGEKEFKKRQQGAQHPLDTDNVDD